jgi:hypothetical protein
MAHGFKTGGRKKVSLNKVNSEMRAAIAASGETPLEYMLRVMRDPKADGNRRDEMAKAAAPYIHPRLASIAQSVETETVQYIVSDRPMSDEEWERRCCTPREKNKSSSSD